MIGSLCSNESLCGNINLGDFGSRVDTANTPISLIWEFCATEFNYSEQVGKRGLSIEEPAYMLFSFSFMH